MQEWDESERSELGTEDSLLGAIAEAPTIGFAPGRLEGVPRISDGEWVDEKYRIQGAPIGRGSFGIVYRAWDEYLADSVALKFVRRGRRAEETLTALFRRAARAHHRLNHPNIVGFRAWGFWQGAPYLVFEYVKGRSLHEYLCEVGAVEPALAVSLAMQLLDALEHAHSRSEPVIHQDLKPENVLLTAYQQVKVLDFGFAELRNAPPDREVPDLGTPLYMSPERWRGGAADASTDLWAVGVLLFEMLVGEPPFRTPAEITQAVAAEPGGLSARLRGLPEALSGAVMRALSPVPAARFTSAGQFRSAIQDAPVERTSTRPDLALDAEARPYRYLEPFRESEREWFFGRDRESAELTQIVEHRSLVLLTGPSGAGKTSLLQAGLLPRLRRPRDTVIVVRPGAEPLHALRDRLLESCPDAGFLLEDAVPATIARTAAAVLRAQAEATGGRVILLVDQFEELFTLTRDSRTRNLFVTSLLPPSPPDPGCPVHVVLALRSDFLGEIVQHSPGLWDLVRDNIYPLPQPSRRALLDALREPLIRLGYEIDDHVAQEIIQAVEREASPLPFLQVAASRLWEERERHPGRVTGGDRCRLLGKDALAAIGGVVGILTSSADRVVEVLPSEELDVARQILVGLVTEGRARARLSRREVLSWFPQRDLAERILGHLINGRLITASRGSEEDALVELAHDALVERWGLLQDWLEQKGELWVHRKLLRHATTSWGNGRRREYFLWRGARLREELRRAPAYPTPLTRDERAFLDACVAHRRWIRSIVWTLLSIFVGIPGLMLLVVLILPDSVPAGRVPEQLGIEGPTAPEEIVEWALAAHGGYEQLRRKLSKARFEVTGAYGDIHPSFKGVRLQAGRRSALVMSSAATGWVLTPRGCWMRYHGVVSRCSPATERLLRNHERVRHLATLYPLREGGVKLERMPDQSVSAVGPGSLFGGDRGVCRMLKATYEGTTVEFCFDLETGLLEHYTWRGTYGTCPGTLRTWVTWYRRLEGITWPTRTATYFNRRLGPILEEEITRWELGRVDSSRLKPPPQARLGVPRIRRVPWRALYNVRVPRRDLHALLRWDERFHWHHDAVAYVSLRPWRPLPRIRFLGGGTRTGGFLELRYRGRFSSRARRKRVPAHEEAVVVHRGSFLEAQRHFEELSRWIRDQGWKPAGPPGMVPHGVAWGLLGDQVLAEYFVPFKR